MIVGRSTSFHATEHSLEGIHIIGHGALAAAAATVMRHRYAITWGWPTIGPGGQSNRLASRQGPRREWRGLADRHQLCQRNCCGLRAESWESTTLTRAGPRKFIASSSAPLQVLRILDEEALAAEGLHHLVVAGAVDQRVRLHVEHRVFRDLRHARADAAIVEHDDLDREVVAAERLHLHAGEADRRVARDLDDRPVGMHDAGGDGEAHADAHRAVAAGVEAGARR